MSRGQSEHDNAREPSVSQISSSDTSKKQQSMGNDQRMGSGAINDFSSENITVLRKASRRVSAGAQPQLAQQKPLAVTVSGLSVDRASSRQSAASKQTQIYIPRSAAPSSTHNLRNISKYPSNTSLGRKPPPVLPGRPDWQTKPSNEGLTKLESRLPIDASVNLAYHELLKESNGAHANPVPKALRKSTVYEQSNAPVYSQLEKLSSRLSVDSYASTIRQPSEAPHKATMRPPSSSSLAARENLRPLSTGPPHQATRDRNATRKELTALLDPLRRKALPPEPVIGIPPPTRNRSSNPTLPKSSTGIPSKSQHGPSRNSISSIPEPLE
ncbi:MAG: hypothetical protein LQ340_007998, partial [Diploschistes diacapsis]